MSVDRLRASPARNQQPDNCMVSSVKYSIAFRLAIVYRQHESHTETMKTAFLSILINVLIAVSAFAQGSCGGVEHDAISQSGGVQSCCERSSAIPGDPVRDSGANTTPSEGSSGDLCPVCSDIEASVTATLWGSVFLTGEDLSSEIQLVMTDQSYSILRPPQA